MQLCNYAVSLANHGIRLLQGKKVYQALRSLASCLPHSALNSLPPSQATCSLRLPVGAFPAACQCSSCLPIQLLAAFRLLACPFRLLAEIFFLGCLPAPLAIYPVFSLLAWPSGCLPDPWGCLPPLSGCLPPPSGCLAGLRAACLLCGLPALPVSFMAPCSPLAHCLC